MPYRTLLSTALLSCCVLMFGCNTAPKSGEADSKTKLVELATLMNQAAAAEKSVTKAAAIAQYEEAAKMYPAAKQPWVRIAQIQYESLNYGEAIIAAQQVVARDGRDKIAQSILSVSGLRVSTRALADLSRQNELDGSVKSEAQNLARLIRESLGERVLVPASTPDAGRASSPPLRAPVARPGVTLPKVPDTPDKRSGNPFDVLK